MGEDALSKLQQVGREGDCIARVPSGVEDDASALLGCKLHMQGLWGSLDLTLQGDGAPNQHLEVLSRALLWAYLDDGFEVWRPGIQGPAHDMDDGRGRTVQSQPQGAGTTEELQSQDKRSFCRDTMSYTAPCP